MLTISSIVEGHGEVQAVPILLRRIAATFDPRLVLRVNPPLRVKRDRFIRDTLEFTRYVELAARKAQPHGGVFILLDAEDNCPAILGPDLLQRAQAIRSDIPFAVVLAKHEYESWFLAAARSLRGIGGLPLDLDPPADPEGRSGAKEWLEGRLTAGRYIGQKHQPELTEVFDFAQAARADSFQKCLREVRWLLNSLAKPR